MHIRAQNAALIVRRLASADLVSVRGVRGLATEYVP